mmetsp:Transcript_64296/g.188123  ORF Transcript_64296/g.188123 Transcript_64296/m.188123 type:complete len:214 (-) Transcript_64296:875-1516(-)
MRVAASVSSSSRRRACLLAARPLCAAWMRVAASLSSSSCSRACFLATRPLCAAWMRVAASLSSSNCFFAALSLAVSCLCAASCSSSHSSASCRSSSLLGVLRVPLPSGVPAAWPLAGGRSRGPWAEREALGPVCGVMGTDIGVSIRGDSIESPGLTRTGSMGRGPSACEVAALHSLRAEDRAEAEAAPPSARARAGRPAAPMTAMEGTVSSSA